MAKPTESLEFAEQSVYEYATAPDGSSVLVGNKEEPSVQFKQSGFRYRAKVLRQYINYMFYSLCAHMRYQYEGELGDVKFLPPATTQQQVEARFGNTWTDRGTDTFAGQTYRVFERTA